MSDNQNITRIKVVYSALAELASEVVFVGGATVSLYKDRIVSESRVTDDVDIVVEIAAYKEFSEIEEKLRGKGFSNDTTSKVVCRYIVKGVVVDIMPTKIDILGFANSWYADGVKHTLNYKIDESINVKIFNAVYFLAAKIEAFKNRGRNDGRTSSDFEDIVYVLNSRSTIWTELSVAPKEVKKYIGECFQELLDNNYLYEWISVHLDWVEQKRVTLIVGGMIDFVKLTLKK